MYMILLMANPRLMGVKCLNKDKLAEFVLIPVYFPSTMIIYKMSPTIFILMCIFFFKMKFYENNLILDIEG